MSLREAVQDYLALLGEGGYSGNDLEAARARMAAEAGPAKVVPEPAADTLPATVTTADSAPVTTTTAPATRKTAARKRSTAKKTTATRSTSRKVK